MTTENDVTVKWSVWFYRPGRWVGPPIYFGNAEGCTRTLLIGTRWTGCIVFGLWQMRYDPTCPGCMTRQSIPPETWDDSVAPGGYVCSVCRIPTEDEPCAEHGPDAGATCPGCGHRCCPYKGETQALDCAGESDVVRACELRFPTGGSDD